jgi:hypothetical protein
VGGLALTLRTPAVAFLTVLLAFLTVPGHGGGKDADGVVTVRERLVQKGKCGCENRSCDGKTAL